MPARTAWITLRHQPHYRADAFAAGFEALGFQVKMAFPPHKIAPGDVVVVWNLNPRYRGAAETASKAGAALLVAENGYVPKAGEAQQYYALARNGHNGSGTWFVGPEDRWALLGQTLHPWQDNEKGHILIADQRGIGSDLMKCPAPFYDTVVPRIKKIFMRKLGRNSCPEIKWRRHPGRHAPTTTLSEDLRDCRAVVTWASNVANEALLAGIPTFRCAPYHVNAAALSDLTELPSPSKPDRLAAFKKVAWAQWSLPELENGIAFQWALRDVL